jgi:DMSO/TMAO reductase YedYZ molybdopterin-dependent catalytic subunit
MTDAMPPNETRGEAPTRLVWLAGAFVGLLTAGVAVAVSQLAAVLTEEAAAPVFAVGAAAIELAPTPVKEWAISTLGEGGKTALLVGIGLIMAIAAAGMGVLALRRPAVAFTTLFVFGAVGLVAAVTRPAAGSLALVPSAAGAIAGAVALGLLIEAAQARESADAETDAASNGDRLLVFTDRRRFLLTGLGVGGVALLGGVGTQLAGGARRRTMASREALRFPPPADPAPSPLPPDVDVEGLSSFYTPNDVFYRVDTALVVPKIDAADWRLRIHGMVDREVTLDMESLLARPLIERDITIACVSNEVGGGYIGNARWVGAALGPILEEAGVQSGANQVVSRSQDGFTIGTPTEVLMDGRDAMLAVTMNGEPLPLEHGFPVRMVVPGLYGYVSATKWVVDLELTTFDAYDAYWVRRGWAARAPIKTMSRIDTPRSGRRLEAGEVVPIAGVAWAQNTGIDRVEVRVDEEEWGDAGLSELGTLDTWRQWVYPWRATPGSHTIQVRATDGSGYTQTMESRPPLPDGATGWHTINVSVG